MTPSTDILTDCLRALLMLLCRLQSAQASLVPVPVRTVSHPVHSAQWSHES